MRRALRVLYPLVVVVGMLVMAGPASAVFGIGDCKDAPVAESPGGGIAGFFGTPGKAPADPKGGAWANGAPMYENYGMAGMHFNNYDLGCGPDITRDPGAVIGTTVGNWTLEISKFGVALTGGLLHAAYHPTYLQTLDPLLVNSVKVLQRAIFDKWVPVTLALVGLMLLWRSRRGEWSHLVAVVSWALLVLVIAFLVFTWPVKAGSATDGTMASVLGSVNTGINGQGNVDDPSTAATGAMADAVIFEQWKMGTFGRANSKTAAKYARVIYTNQALTYAEAAKVQSNPAEGKRIIDAKAAAWKAAADKIKAEDPDAYQYLTGRRGETRFIAGLISLFAALCTMPFLLIAGALLIGAYLIVRLAVVFLPALAVVGVAWQARGAVVGVGTVVAAAVLNSIMFGVGAAVDILAVRTLIAPQSQIPLWLALCLMGVFSLIMWVALKPMRRLTSMANPNTMFAKAAGAVGDTGRKVAGETWGMAKQAAASYAGVSMALPDDEPVDVGGKRKVPERSEAYSAPVAAPAPAPAPTPPALGAAPDRSGLDPTPVTTPLPGSPGSGNLPAPAPLTTTRPPAASDVVAPTFVPGAEAAPVREESLPRVAEPEIDESTGEEIYVLFRPDEEDAR